MAGRTRAEAVHNYRDPLQQALSCVTHAGLYIRGRDDASNAPYALMLRQDPAILGRDGRLSLTMIQHYRVIEAEVPRGPWKVQIVAYYYTVSEPGDPSRELFGYHWHPQGRSRVTSPHFHLYEGAHIGREDMRKAHFPTGRIALEDVLRLVIQEFGVMPLRDDWAEILDRTQAAFEDWRTWL